MNTFEHALEEESFMEDLVSGWMDLSWDHFDDPRTAFKRFLWMLYNKHPYYRKTMLQHGMPYDMKNEYDED